MKLLLTIAIGLLPALVSAHVGSPNVFFDGQAGPYPVRVIIRPPSVLPGAAQVDVRVDGATNVVLQAALWEAGSQAAPEPASAAPVPGEPNSFNGAVWLYFAGAYSVHVRVEGSRGAGAAIVPLNSTALRPPDMSPPFATLLVGLGILLFAGAVWFVAVSAREGVLETGALPDRQDRTRARHAAVVFTLVLTAALWSAKSRWQRMDREFRANALHRPVPIQASVSTNAGLHLLQLAPAPESPAAPRWDALVADHGKLMHLFLLREPDFNVFAHLHPVRRDPQRFESVLPALPAGKYVLYGEVTHENGLSETLVSGLTLPEPSGRSPRMPPATNLLNDVFCQSPLAIPASAAGPRALDADDSWHVGGRAPGSSGAEARESRLMGGLKMIFDNRDEMIENRETLLRFVVLTPDDAPAPLQPYMGMTGHCVVRRSDGAVFTHLHPVGTISMAAQQLLLLREGTGAPGPAEQGIVNNGSDPNHSSRANETTFPYAFPRSGAYRLWVQVRTNGRVLTGVFEVQVTAAP